MHEITAIPRDEKVSLDALRDDKRIPCVVYGKGEETKNLSIAEADFVKLYNQAGESSVITLQVGKDSVDAIIQDMQQHAVSGKVLNVDFKIVHAGETMTVEVPLEFVGISPAAKNGLGQVAKMLHEIEIEVLPKDLPQSIEVDLGVLVDADSIIYAKDITLPAGVTLVTGEEDVIATVSEMNEEPEDTGEAQTIDMDAIQVEKKGKKEEEAPSEE